MNRPHGSPPLPGPLLPPREEREKILRALPPRAALAVLACPGLLSCCPFGALRFRGSMRDTSFRGIPPCPLPWGLSSGHRVRRAGTDEFFRALVAITASEAGGTHGPTLKAKLQSSCIP